MRVKVNTRLESVFSYAVAMDNRGLRNIIHCIRNCIYIVNFDHSMILRFSLRKNEAAFKSPVSFNANDYDSPNFELVDGKIVFNVSEGGYERKKICATAGYSAHDVEKIYRDYYRTGSDHDFLFHLSSSCCTLLDDRLSHIEISTENGRLILRQRNIYTGTIVEVTMKRAGLLDEVKLPESFGPVGLKTKDFVSLFSFSESLAFIPAGDFIMVKDHMKGDFDGVLAFCKYDEIIKLHGEKGGEEDRGQEQKIRRSK